MLIGSHCICICCASVSVVVCRVNSLALSISSVIGCSPLWAFMDVWLGSRRALVGFRQSANPNLRRVFFHPLIFCSTFSTLQELRTSKPAMATNVGRAGKPTSTANESIISLSIFRLLFPSFARFFQPFQNFKEQSNDERKREKHDYFGSSIHFVLCLVSSIQGRVGCAAAVFCDRVFGLLPTFA